MEYGHEAVDNRAVLMCLAMATKLSPRHLHLHNHTPRCTLLPHQYSHSSFQGLFKDVNCVPHEPKCSGRKYKLYHKTHCNKSLEQLTDVHIDTVMIHSWQTKAIDLLSVDSRTNFFKHKTSAFRNSSSAKRQLTNIYVKMILKLWFEQHRGDTKT